MNEFDAMKWLGAISAPVLILAAESDSFSPAK